MSEVEEDALFLSVIHQAKTYERIIFIENQVFMRLIFPQHNILLVCSAYFRAQLVLQFAL